MDTALVTGSTDGLGAEVARRLGDRGWHVIVHGRSRDRGEAVVADIEEAGGTAELRRADLASLAEVRDLAGSVRSDHDRVDLLINNAGVWVTDGREESADGYELHFAVNHLAHFLLTRRLLPLLERSAPARIINVASAAQEALDFHDLMLERDYSPGSGYARSKLAQILFTMDLADELDDRDVDVVALHPATFMDTTMVRDAGRRPRSSVDDGARAVMRLATAPELDSGQYFDGTRPARAHEQAYDPDARKRLREASEELTAER